MAVFAVQYLGTRPKEATPKKAQLRLREAFARLPISMVLLDWDLPPAIEEAVAKETQTHKARLYRWQTWLTGDLHTDLPPDWSVVGLNHEPIRGYANEPDFSFICPNRTAVQEFLLERLESIAAAGLFQGIFLDRIRVPSPSANPFTDLGCFCPHCARLAAEQGIDLPVAQAYIQNTVKEKRSLATLCQALFGIKDDKKNPLQQYLNFRKDSITRSVRLARDQAKAVGLEVGLDCFTPALAEMVGQDLQSLGKLSDWVKIMTYPRVFGPAGISYELSGWLDWLTRQSFSEPEAIQLIQSSSGLSLPPTREELRRNGLGSEAIQQEIQRGREKGINELLAGIALVEVEGVHESTPEQIRADLMAARSSAGLVLSWDLWKIPPDYLDMIGRLWEIQ